VTSSPSRARPALPPLLLAACLAACGGPADPGDAGRRNVVLISLDTCRTDSLGFAGGERPTPHLDRLAEESVVFEDCMAQSSATAPSHLSILTGYHVQRHGLLKNGERSWPRESLAQTLRDLGYKTAAFTGHGSLQGKFGHGLGFDAFITWHLPPGVPSDEEGAAPYQRYISEAIEEAEGFLDEYQDQPFFLFVHGYDPHLPFWPKEPERSEYAGWYEGDLDISKVHKRTQFHPLIAQGLLGEEERRYLRDLYDAEIVAADRAIGAFLESLEERGLLDRTIVVFTSDHGELLGEHDWVGHGLFYEEVLAVPLLIRFPDGRWAGRHDAPVQHVDIVPTLLSALGVPVFDGVQGADLMPLVRGEGAVTPPDRMRVGRRAGDVALRFADHPELRLLFRQPGGRVTNLEVFDMRADPEQRTNLTDDPAVLERVQPLIRRYFEWSRENMGVDASFRGEKEDIQEEDKDMLRALGYIGDDE
jgi:arylsulfatase A-like enzyme